MKKTLFGLVAGMLVLASCGGGGSEASAEGDEGKKDVVIDTVRRGDGMRIAYFRSDSLGAKYKRLESLNEELKQKQDEYEKRLNSLQTEFQAFYQKVEKEYPVMAKSDQQAAEQKLQRMQTNLQNEQQRMSAELAEIQEKMFASHLETVTRVAKEYAQSHGFDYVFSYEPGGSMIYGDDAYDITNEIVDILNKEHMDLVGE
jgi:outer membrane protein